MPGIVIHRIFVAIGLKAPPPPRDNRRTRSTVFHISCSRKGGADWGARMTWSRWFLSGFRRSISVLTVIATFVFAGCSGQVPSPASLVPNETNALPAPPTAAPLKFKGTVAMTHLSGPSQTASDRVAGALNRAAEVEGWALLAYSEAKADRRIQGYMTASRIDAEIEISYVWDIFDAQGQKIERVTGAERHKLPPGQIKDAWDAVADDALVAMARQVMTIVVANRGPTPPSVALPAQR